MLPLQQDSNPQSLSSKTNTQPLSQAFSKWLSVSFTNLVVGLNLLAVT